MTFAFLLYKYFPYGGMQRDFRRFVEEVSARVTAQEVIMLTTIESVIALTAEELVSARAAAEFVGP